MRLQDHIDSFTRENTLIELRKLLMKDCKVSISQWGNQCVSIQGYEGAVRISALISTFQCAGECLQLSLSHLEKETLSFVAKKITKLAFDANKLQSPMLKMRACWAGSIFGQNIE